MSLRLPVVRETNRRYGADFATTLEEHGFPALTGGLVTSLQINVGKRCNQACHHCHVEAGPQRTEIMVEATADRVMELLDATPTIAVVDITGGAPELNPNFRRLVARARAAGRQVIDRCNLTILLEPGHEDTAAFLAQHRVTVTASLPCYGRDNVDRQRGKGVFEASIQALRQLNELGYGKPDTGLELNLVYNPVGAFLPPPQAGLQADYKARLRDEFGVEFNHLFTLTNMPISRFAHSLERDGQWSAYMSLLVDHFNPATVDGLMCRGQVSVGYDGKLYDCDFNQMLELEIAGSGRPQGSITIWDIDSYADLAGRAIAVDSHCFGCTAGAGSSCGGALS